MKKLPLIVMCLACASAMINSSCSDGKKDAKDSASVAKGTPVDTVGFESSLNIRYVDEEEVLAQYNLAKDMQEAQMRLMSRLESARQSKESELQQLASSMETKMRNNSYTSETQYNADVAQLQKKQQDAQAYLANLERNSQLEAAQQQTELMDSIASYINLYNKDKKYDAILFKSAGLYFNPSLNITKEVIEGLNARYNKKEQK